MSSSGQWRCSLVLALIMELGAWQMALSAPFVMMRAIITLPQEELVDMPAVEKINSRKSGEALYHNRRIYRQTRGMDPLGWALSGPAIDAAATQMNAEYYRSYNFDHAPRNYLYYDWGW